MGWYTIYTHGDSDVISSYHICASCRHVVGQALQNVSYSDITFFVSRAYTDIFLNQLIQFYSNNAINLHHLTTHSTTVLTYKMAIVLLP